jgi:hypothetical protein
VESNLSIENVTFAGEANHTPQAAGKVLNDVFQHWGVTVPETIISESTTTTDLYDSRLFD